MHKLQSYQRLFHILEVSAAIVFFPRVLIILESARQTSQQNV